MILEFGKHKGKDLSKVPKHYLEWLHMNLEEELVEKQALLEAIEEELKCRQ